MQEDTFAISLYLYLGERCSLVKTLRTFFSSDFGLFFVARLGFFRLNSSLMPYLDEQSHFIAFAP